MVKLGFIAEGATEKIILEHSDFFNYLTELKLDFIPEVIDAEGNGNLLPHNMLPLTKTLEDKGATQIFILTDLDDDQCITNTKERISSLPNHVVTVSVKAIEAWFLADSAAMRNFLSDPAFSCNNPEIIADPFEEIKSIRMAKNGRGVDKLVLAKLMVRSGFSIQKAALHANCNSAKYFLAMVSGVSAAK